MKNHKLKNFTMKTGKLIIIYLICVFSGSCQLSNNNSDAKSVSQEIIDTICDYSNEKLISQTTIDITCNFCVLFIRPTIEQIEQIKSNYQNEEDFYIMADDANFYTADAIEYLQNKNIDIFYLDSIKIVCFNEKNTVDFSDLAWDFVLYKKNTSPKVVKAIDLKYEFENYFNANL